MNNAVPGHSFTRDLQTVIPASPEGKFDVSGSGNESLATAFIRTIATKPLWRGLFIVSVNTAMYACGEALSSYFADERDGHLPLYPFNISQPFLGGSVLGFAQGVFQACLTEAYITIHTCIENRSINVVPGQPNVITAKDEISGDQRPVESGSKQ
ncbi:hypothetical protein [Salinisphaera sp. G21_0]|uniref:hypothetical protein n=1 Tax=Salinisphaera sp. G21_0 TaxID=2821094 RepID=UPI001ADA92F4|nr:hypothetical protein [Salinisphaera sp. G21_0]MBO9480203.1 hypothetical protein [Salinisphaera sp. G21_0]